MSFSFGDPTLFEWLGIEPDDLDGPIRECFDAFHKALRATHVKDQREAALIAVLLMGSLISAQSSRADRDRLVKIARHYLDQVPENWATAQQWRQQSRRRN